MIIAVAHLVRLARAGLVFAREGVFALVDPAQLLDQVEADVLAKFRPPEIDASVTIS